MFSGIVECSAHIVECVAGSQVLDIAITKPENFSELKIGDSISVNGICLTLTKFTSTLLFFTLGPETLKITGWTAATVLNQEVNLERSLRMADRIHGHLLTGHVDVLGTVKRAELLGQALRLDIQFGEAWAPYVWRKGSIAINGVSLTINEAGSDWLSVTLIPETLKVTNLKNLKVGDQVTLEMDNLARGLVRWAELKDQTKEVSL